MVNGCDSRDDRDSRGCNEGDCNGREGGCNGREGVVMVVKGIVRMNFWPRVVLTIERFDFEVLRGLFLFPKLFFETFYCQKLFQEFLKN